MNHDLFSLRIIKQILKENGLQPIKRWGQNFLICENIFKKVIQAADLKENETIIEIGAGLGGLTKELAKSTKKVIALEKDKKLIPVLKQNLKGLKNIEIVQMDCLDYRVKIKNYKVVANLPYYLTSRIIKKFLEEKNPAQTMILMVQKEVAQRIMAKPPQMNLLALSVRFYAKPEIISYVPQKCFWPKPKVDSAIIKLKVNPSVNKQKMIPDREKFFKVVKTGFSQPRKQLVNNLSSGLRLEKGKIIVCLEKNKIKPSQRAQELTLGDWLNLAESLPFKNNF